MTKLILLLLVGFLVVCAIGVSFAKSLLASVVIFMSPITKPNTRNYSKHR